jgi:acetyl esterase/lipase
MSRSEGLMATATGPIEPDHELDPGDEVDPGYEIETTDEVYARPDGVELLARVHRPVGTSGAVPAVVDAHGGAWRYFDRTVDDFHGRGLAARGHVVVAVDFRQAPEHRWPGAVADLAAAVRWTKAHADRLGVDPKRVALMGGSSGGHLALWVTLRPEAPECRSTAHEGPAGPDARVHAVLALWPVADPAARYRYLLDVMQGSSTEGMPTDETLFDPLRLQRAQDRFFGDIATMGLASIPGLLASGDHDRPPPLWVAHPELDNNVTVAMSEALVAAWRAAGADAHLERYPGQGHSFVNFGGPAAERCVDDLATELRARLSVLRGSTHPNMEVRA